MELSIIIAGCRQFFLEQILDWQPGAQDMIQLPWTKGKASYSAIAIVVSFVSMVVWSNHRSSSLLWSSYQSKPFFGEIQPEAVYDNIISFCPSGVPLISREHLVLGKCREVLGIEQQFRDAGLSATPHISQFLSRVHGGWTLRLPSGVDLTYSKNMEKCK